MQGSGGRGEGCVLQRDPGTQCQASPKAEGVDLTGDSQRGSMADGNGDGDNHYPTIGFTFYFLHWNILHVSSPSLACNSETQKST